VGGDVLVAEAEPLRARVVGGQLVLDRPGLLGPAPPAFGVDAAAERVHAGVQVRADPQAVQPHVVTGVHDRRDLVPRSERVLHPLQEPCPTDTADQHYYVHQTIVPQRQNMNAY
jgi:hypothetical protein